MRAGVRSGLAEHGVNGAAVSSSTWRQGMTNHQGLWGFPAEGRFQRLFDANMEHVQNRTCSQKRAAPEERLGDDAGQISSPTILLRRAQQPLVSTARPATANLYEFVLLCVRRDTVTTLIFDCGFGGIRSTPIGSQSLNPFKPGFLMFSVQRAVNRSETGFERVAGAAKRKRRASGLGEIASRATTSCGYGLCAELAPAGWSSAGGGAAPQTIVLIAERSAVCSVRKRFPSD
jgi:hypothetical protein